jgi:hypothetical protein
MNIRFSDTQLLLATGNIAHQAGLGLGDGGVQLDPQCLEQPRRRTATAPTDEEAGMIARDPSTMRYRIRIRGHLDPAWTEWFDDLALTQKNDGTTELVGPLSDQSALYGLLARLRDLGATLLMVEQLGQLSP